MPLHEGGPIKDDIFMTFGKIWTLSEKERFYKAIKIHGFNKVKIKRIVGSHDKVRIRDFRYWVLETYKKNPDKRYEKIFNALNFV